MNECVKEFKLELEKIYKEMYEKLGDLIDETLLSMSFFDGEDHYDALQEVMIEVLQEQMNNMLYESEESN